MATVFFFSGFSSLVYEVIWMRRLALFFGSDIYSAALTLSAFMGGLTLGSLLAARYVDRLRRHLVWYGLLEILDRHLCPALSRFLNLFSGQYRHIYQTFFDIAPWRYNGFRILVASGHAADSDHPDGRHPAAGGETFRARQARSAATAASSTPSTRSARSPACCSPASFSCRFSASTRTTWVACAINLAHRCRAQSFWE